MPPADVTIYIDGSCYPNPGPGGYGIVVEFPTSMITYKKPLPTATNNRAELLAAIHALQLIQELDAGTSVQIVTDSRYVRDGAVTYLPSWVRREFVAVKNDTLWQRIHSLLLLLSTKEVTVTWKWVRGHSKIPGNELADKLALEAREEAARAPFQKV